jgi:glycosyltransferase involved in cell wall biosynthesis
MKILLISHTCQSRTFGQPKAEILGRMPGLEVRVLIPDRWREYGKWVQADPPEQPGFAQRGVNYQVGKVRWPWTGPGQSYLHWYPELKQILEEFRPNVIDLWEEPWSLVSAHTCWLRNRILPEAVIITETEQNVNKGLPFPFEQFRSYTLRNAAFAVGRNAESLLILRRKGFSGAAEVVPNGVDAGLFRPMDRNACRAALGFEGFVAGYVGRIVEEKGLIDMVDALGLCRENVNLVLVGSGNLGDLLRRRAREIGKERQLKILPGQPFEHLPTVFNALDVLVLPSRTTQRWKEQFGRVIIEAHACGTAVIGSDSGAIPQVVGKGGIIVPERDSVALARAFDYLASNPRECRRLGDIGREQVLDQCTWQRVAEKMHAIYKKVHDRGKAAPLQNPIESTVRA